MEENKFIVFKDWPLEGLNWFDNRSGSLGNIFEHMGAPVDSKYVYSNETPGDLHFSKYYTFNWDSIETGTTANYVFKINDAIESFKDYMRTAREDKFKVLDVQFMKALETGDTTKVSEITSKKNELRDITNIDFTGITNSNQLKSLWPTELLGDSPF